MPSHPQSQNGDPQAESEEINMDASRGATGHSFLRKNGNGSEASSSRNNKKRTGPDGVYGVVPGESERSVAITNQTFQNSLEDLKNKVHTKRQITMIDIEFITASK